MISSIYIEGFRGFRSFEMAALGRVNLLVGTNNSGKTSLLEALHLLTSRAEPRALWNLLWRRGEKSIGLTPRSERQPEVDVSHLFIGHEFHIGSWFALSAKNQTSERRIRFKVIELTEKERSGHRLPGDRVPKLALRIKGMPQPLISTIPLTSTGTISSDSLDIPRRTHGHYSDEKPQVQYVTTDAMDGNYLLALWNRIALTPDEDLVLRALASIDPNIERIAAQVGTTPYWGENSKAGFVIKHKKFENPIPIGSMGDGIWRLFSLAIAITQCRGGVLLVDEIDTGLHHTVMSDMWRLVISTASRFDVQVFATTHSSDCVNSLAFGASNDHQEPGPATLVTLQRIERDQGCATLYTAEEVQMAAQHSLEVR